MSNEKSNLQNNIILFNPLDAL